MRQHPRQDNLPASRRCQMFSGGKTAWLDPPLLDKEGHKARHAGNTERRQSCASRVRAPVRRFTDETPAESAAGVSLPNFETKFLINGPGQGFSAIKAKGGVGCRETVDSESLSLKQSGSQSPRDQEQLQ